METPLSRLLTNARDKHNLSLGRVCHRVQRGLTPTYLRELEAGTNTIAVTPMLLYYLSECYFRDPTYEDLMIAAGYLIRKDSEN